MERPQNRILHPLSTPIDNQTHSILYIQKKSLVAHGYKVAGLR